MEGFRLFPSRDERFRPSAVKVKELKEFIPVCIGGFVEVVQDDEPPLRLAFQKLHDITPTHLGRLLWVTDDRGIRVVALVHLIGEGKEELFGGQRVPTCHGAVKGIRQSLHFVRPKLCRLPEPSLTRCRHPPKTLPALFLEAIVPANSAVTP